MLRKLICATSALAVALCVSVGTTEAKIVSINLTDSGHALAPSDVTGYFAAGNWNNVTSGTTGTLDGTVAGQLVDDSGADSDVIFTWGTGGLRALNTPTGTAADNLLFYGGFESDINGVQATNQFKLENLNAAFAGGYQVIWYLGDSGLTTQSGQGDVYRSTDTAAFTPGWGPEDPGIPSLGTQIVSGGQVGPANNTTFNGTYTLTANGNAFLDVELTDDALVYSFRQTGGGPTFWGLNNVGLQIVSTAPVPEPSTFALAGLGLVGLVGYGLRRRRK